MELERITPQYEQEFFKEFVVSTEKPAQQVVDELLQYNIFGGVPLSLFDKKLENQLLISVTEQRSKAEIDRFVECLSRVL